MLFCSEPYLDDSFGKIIKEKQNYKIKCVPISLKFSSNLVIVYFKCFPKFRPSKYSPISHAE